MLIKRNIWLYNEIRMPDEVAILRFIIVPLKSWGSSDFWEQP